MNGANRFTNISIDPSLFARNHSSIIHQSRFLERQMEDAKKNYSSFASTSASSSMSSERTDQEALRVDSEASTVEVAEEDEADDSSLRSVAIASPAFDKLQGSSLDVPRKASFSLGQENFTDRDSMNTPTVSSTSGDTCYYNSTTMERPPNIAHYRLTSVKELKRGRATMPQLMRSTGIMGSKRLTQTELNDRKRASQDSSSIVLAMDSTLETFNAPKAEPGAHRKRSRDPEAANEEEVKKAMHYFEGVFVPSFTNICGTLLYLRMGYVAGQAGILGGIGIVLFSTFVVGVAAMSCSAICSNGKQLRAGVYYIVSRSLGPQFGGVIGVIFSLANVGMAALYIVGIAEFISDLLTERGYDHFTLSRQDDIRIYSLVVCLILMSIAFAGPDIENRFTLIFTSTYFISYINWVLGTFLPVSDDKFLRGVTGYNWVTTKMNLLPNFRDGESFISVFAVFFPGFTGMLAGTMYIDQLRNPATDVAMGLFTSIATTSGMYLVAVVACGATMLRDASGIEEPFINNVTGLWNTPECASTESCRYGLMNYYQVAEITSAWRPLIIIGMFGMTISSTMTNLDQGPQSFQAACKDAIFPYMKYFGKEHGKNNFPRRAYILLAFFTIALSLIGDLNALNEIVTNMFMATYALVNYACFDASFVRSPGWRPHFEYYAPHTSFECTNKQHKALASANVFGLITQLPKMLDLVALFYFWRQFKPFLSSATSLTKGRNMWVSLFGATICVIIMFVVSVGSSIVISLIFSACLAYFHYSHPDVNWGDTHQAHVYRSALGNLMKLTSSEEHVKNFRPQILLLSGNPASRIPLVDFAHSITKGDSLLVCGHVVPYPPSSRLFTVMNRLQNEMERWLRKNKIKAFYQNLANEKLRYGTMNMFELSGLGKLRPNVVLLGFKSNWIREGVENIQKIEDYVGILRDAFENNYGVAIMRDNGRGFDLSEEFLNLGIKDIDAIKKSFASVPTELDDLDKGTNAFERVNSQLKENFGINVRTINIISKINPQTTIQGSDHKRSKFFSDRHLFEVFGDEEEEDAEDFEGEYDTIIGQNTLTNAGTIQSRTVQSHQRSTERELRRSRSENFGMSKQIQMKLEKEFAATEALAKHMNAFHKKRKGGKVRIDVWWLYDDGGLTLLIPHLLRLPKSYLEGAELRVLTLTGSEDEVNEESMIALLGKFRIEFSSVKVIEINKQKLHPDIMLKFNKISKQWKTTDENQHEALITDEELQIHKKRTYRQLLTRQLLIQHSHDASLVVVTLPVPREGISSCLYMTWLELLTSNLPPCLLVRGNQTSVLTFYS